MTLHEVFITSTTRRHQRYRLSQAVACISFCLLTLSLSSLWHMLHAVICVCVDACILHTHMSWKKLVILHHHDHMYLQSGTCMSFLHQPVTTLLYMFY